MAGRPQERFYGDESKTLRTVPGLGELRGSGHIIDKFSSGINVFMIYLHNSSWGYVWCPIIHPASPGRDLFYRILAGAPLHSVGSHNVFDGYNFFPDYECELQGRNLYSDDIKWYSVTKLLCVLQSRKTLVSYPSVLSENYPLLLNPNFLILQKGYKVALWNQEKPSGISSCGYLLLMKNIRIFFNLPILGN